GQIFDYVLPHEKVKNGEVVTDEKVEEVLTKLHYIK
ncbi:TPA: Paratox, partial [Streptococcus equi subsp. equi]|nr:Paratox [Streptococcus equi subsp. equi]